MLKAAEPFYPAQALATHAEGVVQVLVVLDDRSRVVWTEVQSSPSVLLNDEAVRSARSSTYRGAIHNCRPVPATYIFSVDFSMRR
jgi:outer membrane biosynthesis protein TonB